MAKGKGKKARIPKRVAGVRIPKEIRKSASPLLALVESQTGRALAAEILIAVAGVLSGRSLAKEGPAHAGQDIVRAASGTGHAMQGIAEAAIGAAARALHDALPSAAPQDEARRTDRMPEGGLPRKH